MRRSGPSLWPYIKPYSESIGLIVLLHVAGVAAQIGMIALLSPILTGVDDEGGDDSFLMYGAILVFITAGFSFIIAITSHIASRVSSSITADLRNDIMRTVMDLDDISSAGWSPTRAMTVLTGDVKVVQDYIYECLRSYVSMPMLMAALLYETFLLNVNMGVAMLAVFAAVCLVTYVVGVRLYPLYRKQMSRLDKVNAILREKIPGGRMIRAYDGTEYEEEKFEAASGEFGAVTKAISMRSCLLPILATASVWMLVVMSYAVAAASYHKDTVFVELMLFMQYTAYLVGTMSVIPFLCLNTPRAFSCMGSILELIHARDNRAGKREASSPRDGAPAIRAENLATAEGRALKGLSFEVGPEETVTLAGPNGCGESEFVSVMLGFSRCSSGSLEVLGMDASSSDPARLREAVAYCGNSMVLLRGPLSRSIDPRGEHDEEEIMDVCRLLGLDDAVASLPKGLETEISDRKAELSGGQRQLVAIARCILNPAHIHVFDDCFFSLDMESRAKAMRAIKERCSGAILFVMHDLSTAGISDRVIMLDEGKVAEDVVRLDGLRGRLSSWNRRARGPASGTSPPSNASRSTSARTSGRCTSTPPCTSWPRSSYRSCPSCAEST